MDGTMIIIPSLERAPTGTVSTPGAFHVAGPADSRPENDAERANSNQDEDNVDNNNNNSGPYLEAEVVPIVSNAVPVQPELVVEGVVEKWIDFGNPRVRALGVALVLVFAALVVAIGFFSNQKQPPAREAGCGSSLSKEGNASRCDVVAGTSTTPSIRSNSESAVPSDVPTLTLSVQPTISPTKKGWTMLHSEDVWQNIPTSKNCIERDLSGDASRRLIDCRDSGPDRVYLHVVELTLENGWVSVFNVEKEFDLPSSMSFDGTTFAVCYFGVLHVYKQLNTDVGNTNEWRQHVIDNSYYREWRYRKQTLSLSGDGNRLATLRLSTSNKTDIVIYDCVNDKNQTWIETDVFDCFNKNLNVKISFDGSTVVLSEFNRRDNSILVKVIKYNELESSWQRREEVLKAAFHIGLLSISGEGDTIAFDAPDSMVTNILQYKTSLSKYEWSIEVAEGSLPSLSGSGTRIAIAFLKKGEVRVYDILGNRLIQIVENIDPCNKVKSCNIENLSLSHDGSKLTIFKCESDHEIDDLNPFWLFVNTYEIQV